MPTLPFICEDFSSSSCLPSNQIWFFHLLRDDTRLLLLSRRGWLWQKCLLFDKKFLCKTATFLYKTGLLPACCWTLQKHYTFTGECPVTMGIGDASSVLRIERTPQYWEKFLLSRVGINNQHQYVCSETEQRCKIAESPPPHPTNWVGEFAAECMKLMVAAYF